MKIPKYKDVRIKTNCGTRWYITNHDADVGDYGDIYLHKDGTWHTRCGTENFHKTKESAQKLVDKFCKGKKEELIECVEKLSDKLFQAQIEFDKARKELADFNKPKVGQKYKHNDGSLHLLVIVGNEYALVCYDDEDCKDYGWVGTSYGCHSCKKIKDVFGGYEDYFTLID